MLPKWVDAWRPPGGPCGFCGCDDCRHRMTDTIWEALQAGESEAQVAAGLEVPAWVVARIGRLKRAPRVR